MEYEFSPGGFIESVSPAVGTGIVAFIEARLDEREAYARSIGAADGFYPEPYDLDSPMHHDRVLATLAKDRAILALHRPVHYVDEFVCTVCAPDVEVDNYIGGTAYPCQTVRLLAAIDADHPDFDPSWKPVAT